MNNFILNFINENSNDMLIRAKKLPKEILFLSGSFNPFHNGHKELLKAAEKICKRNGVLELSVINVDKPRLTVEIIEERLKTIPKEYPVLLTKKSTFIEKAESYPKACFTIGYDTAIRLIDEKYHKDVNYILDRYLELDIQFIVGGRMHKNKFLSLENMKIPKKYEKLFIDIPQSLFRQDISSTQLRNLN